MKTIISAALISFLFLVSCKKEVKKDDSQISTDPTNTSSKEKSFSKKELIGDWITGEYKDGFQLNGDGTAKSINNATLRYSKWELKGDLLLLDNLSIGNHTSGRGVDTLQIQSLTNNELKVKAYPGRILIYRMPSNEDKLDYYTFPADTIIK